ncbi:MAG: polysaccharide biosynthesis C-terminal domain-containing protein [Bacteroidota bacterium]
MKIDTREYLKLSFIYTLVAAVPPLIQVLIQPIYEGSDKLNAIDFSQLAITELFTSLVFVLATFSMGNAISRFYYDYMDDRKGYDRLVSSVFISILIRGFIILGIGFLFSDYIGRLFVQPALQDFSSYGYASIITGIGRAVNITAAALYRNEKKVMNFVYVNIGLGIFRTGFQLAGLFMFDMSFIGYINGSAIGTSITTLAVLIYTYRRSGFRYDFKIMKSVNQFASPLTQYGIVVWALAFADKYFLEKYPADLGIYNTAAGFALGISIVLQGLQGANQPEVFRVMKEGIEKQQETIRKLSNMLLAQSQLVIASAIIPVMLYLTLFYTTQIRFAAGLVTIIFLRNLVRTQYVVFSYSVYYMKKTKFFFYLNLVVLAVNLLLNFLLIPTFKFYGAIAAGIVSDTIQVVGIYFYQKSIITINWNLKKTLYFPLALMGIAILMEYIKIVAGLNPFITSSVVVLSMFTGLFILYKVEIRGFIAKKWMRYS